ncbi:serine/arginine repetitive matrix protein 1-like [Frankliniella occidentalis]|uniref:Serine/arginine repetitive matrix protein 1-like n=1 Tax=Frankliniella occidentalis TaxID=133901 RepID=A0A6J1THD1_FRAOC|nr:serine/arginine repetitive matrix protein 1-like [Frankliniella occidentalis]
MDDDEVRRMRDARLKRMSALGGAPTESTALVHTDKKDAATFTDYDSKDAATQTSPHQTRDAATQTSDSSQLQLVPVSAMNGASQPVTPASFGPEHLAFFMKVYTVFKEQDAIEGPISSNAPYGLSSMDQSTSADPTLSAPSRVQDVDSSEAASSPRRSLSVGGAVPRRKRSPLPVNHTVSPERDWSFNDVSPRNSRHESRFRDRRHSPLPLGDTASPERDWSHLDSSTPPRHEKRIFNGFRGWPSNSVRSSRPTSIPAGRDSPERDWSFLDNPSPPRSLARRQEESNSLRRHHSPEPTDTYPSGSKYRRSSSHTNSSRQKSSPQRNWRESAILPLDSRKSSPVRGRSPDHAERRSRRQSPSTSNFRDRRENAAKPSHSCRAPPPSPERDWSFLDNPTSNLSSTLEAPVKLKTPGQQEGAAKGDNSKKKKGSGREPAQCYICLEKGRKELYSTTCGHTFHKTCIESWAKREEQHNKPKDVCPVCKTRYNKIFKAKF